MAGMVGMVPMSKKEETQAMHLELSCALFFVDNSTFFICRIVHSVTFIFVHTLGVIYKIIVTYCNVAPRAISVPASNLPVHTPQVFVANPRKPPEITRILLNNKVKLIAYLENFHNERVSKLVAIYLYRTEIQIHVDSIVLKPLICVFFPGLVMSPPLHFPRHFRRGNEDTLGHP